MLLKVIKLWFDYWLSYWPAVPGFGSVDNGDCIFVQAFGRNKYTDAELGKELFRIRRLVDLDDLKTFELLKQEGFEPGKSNRALARYAMRLCGRRGGIPIIAQWEVAFAIYAEDSIWFMKNIHLIDSLWPLSDYFATAHVKMASKVHMNKRHCCKPIELAHPAMTTRAIPIIWGTGVDCIVEPINRREISTHELWVWDENSVQPWTRSWDAWRHREFIGRVAHVLTHVPISAQLLGGIRAAVPDKIKQMIPGNWIAFFPPELETI